MGLPELKQKIYNQIENADERILSIVSSVFDNYKPDLEIIATSNDNVFEPIVAYDVEGKPLTLKQYNEEIDKGIADFENGRYISQEDLEREIDSWYDE
jgi:predicted transcriptional regulator